MGLNFAARAASIFIVLFLVSACGELETLFPSNGSYQVKTLVNGVPIEDGSLIRSGDKIRPYFVVSVADDPDLIGLMIYFQDSLGKITDGKIKYTVRPDAEEITQEETQEQEETEQDTDEVVSEQAEDEANDETVAEIEIEIAVQEIEEKDIEFAVRSLAGELPYFSLPVSLEIGYYTLVFEALGNRETLTRTEVDIFYLGNAEFNLKDITMYLPGLSDSQIISPGTTVLLETRLDFDARLDPYVIWYNGKNIISEGKIRDDAGSILWVAPEQAGFYSLRMEAFPFRLKNKFSGVFRGIALPVSPKAVDMSYFFKSYTAQNPLAERTAYPELTTATTPEDSDNSRPPVRVLPPELLQWYQFEGSLDSSPLLSDEQSVLPVNDKKAVRWAGAGQCYGLSTGADDVYQLPPVNFLKGKDRGGGIFLSHVRLPAEGVILSAFFPLKASSGEGAWVEMIGEGNVIALIINAGGAAVEIPLHLDLPELQGFIPIVTEFYIRPNRLEARITLGEDMKSNAGGIGLSAALSGEAKIRMGGREKFKRENKLEAPIPATEDPVITATTAEDESPDISEADEALLLLMENREANAIWDELAILLSAVPVFPEELVEKPPVEAVSGNGTAVITPALYALVEGMAPTADDEKTGGDDNLLSPVANTDTDDPIPEPEMLSVLSEDP
jgi:hypothetical protein